MNPWTSLSLLFALSTVLARSEARIGSEDSGSSAKKRPRHSGRLLGRPDPLKCSRRPRQYQDRTSGHYYFFSEDTSFKVEFWFVLVALLGPVYLDH